MFGSYIFKNKFKKNKTRTKSIEYFYFASHLDIELCKRITLSLTIKRNQATYKIIDYKNLSEKNTE